VFAELGTGVLEGSVDPTLRRSGWLEGAGGSTDYSEMEAMQAAGLFAADIVVMATRNGAQAMGRLKDFGTLEAASSGICLFLGRIRALMYGPSDRWRTSCVAEGSTHRRRWRSENSAS
jgi:hypothetical protein